MNYTERFNKVTEICKENDLGHGSVRDHEMFEKLKDAELNDPEKIAKIVTDIKAYYEYESRNKKYPNYIYEAVRQNLGVDKYDFSVDCKIDEMSHDEVLLRICIWKSIPGFDITIKKWIRDIYGTQLQSITYK